MYRARLLGFGLAEDAVAAVEAEVRAEVDAATETAKAASPPSLDLIERDVYADGGAAWRN
jgi:pyruvate dehydrogenase E1 component alpha subunit